MSRISDFQIKDIVNVSDGKKLGNITDINLNLAAGTIDSIVISRAGKIFGIFGKEEEVVIPWSQIVKIGEDVILVRHHTMQSALHDNKREE